MLSECFHHFCFFFPQQSWNRGPRGLLSLMGKQAWSCDMICPSQGQQEAGSGARLGRPWDGFLEEEGQLAKLCSSNLRPREVGTCCSQPRAPVSDPTWLVPNRSD